MPDRVMNYIESELPPAVTLPAWRRSRPVRKTPRIRLRVRSV
jgi:hypothetical protein